MRNVSTVLTNKSVSKVFVFDTLTRSDTVRALVFTDTHMFYFEFCDADAVGREGFWIVKGKVWNKENAPSLYTLDETLGIVSGNFCLSISPSLHDVTDERIVRLLKKVKMSGRKLILPKDVVLMEELDEVALNKFYGNEPVMDDDDCPF